jgi:hypothetical protein
MDERERECKNVGEEKRSGTLLKRRRVNSYQGGSCKSTRRFSEIDFPAKGTETIRINYGDVTNRE